MILQSMKAGTVDSPILINTKYIVRVEAGYGYGNDYRNHGTTIWLVGDVSGIWITDDFYDFIESIDTAVHTDADIATDRLVSRLDELLDKVAHVGAAIKGSGWSE